MNGTGMLRMAFVMAIALVVWGATAPANANYFMPSAASQCFYDRCGPYRTQGCLGGPAAPQPVSCTDPNCNIGPCVKVGATTTWFAPASPPAFTHYYNWSLPAIPRWNTAW